MKKMIFATNNSHKLQEVQEMLGNTYEILSLENLGCTEDIPETSDTFTGNAQQKSDYVVKHYGMDCFADDSGLEVDALGGAPGVFSARYSGSRDMRQNLNLLLQNLDRTSHREARFRTVISLFFSGAQYFFEGSVAGHILTAPRGSDGFGYDPVFVPTGHNRSFAEMTLAEKNQISHRAIAVRKLVEFLKTVE